MGVALVLAASGVAASVPLIPTDGELAFLRFKDQLYESARAQLEQRLAEGDLSVAVVRPLAELHLQYADVDSAILLLERFVAEHPDDLAARRVLGTYYQFGQRPYDYLRNLEQIASRAPASEVLRELAEIYSWMDEPDKQIDTLARLDQRGLATVDELVALARLRAARGRYAEAVGSLERAERLAPDALDADGLELLASLLVDAGRGEEALARLAQRPDVRDDLDLAVRLARTFQGKRHPELAARLLEALPALDVRNAAALATLTQAEVDAGLAPQALARLIELQRAGSLPDAMTPTLVDLAVYQGDFATAWSAGRALGWAAIPRGALAGLAAAAYAHGRADDVQALVREAGEDCLAGVPVLAAQLAADRGDRSAARRWIARADAAALAGPDDQVALAAVERRLGSAEAAYQRLRRHLSRGDVSAWAVESFAQAALETRHAGEAAPLLRRVRARLGAPADAAWARVATAAGETAAVLAWLRSSAPSRVPAQALRDVAYLALDARRPEVAMAAARWLPASGATRDDRLLLARALSESGDAEGALDVLRPLASRDAAAAALLDATLAHAAAASPRAREEFVRRASGELSSPALTAARRGELAWALVSAGATDAALLAMAPLLRADLDAWLPAYLEQAKRAASREGPIARLVGELQRTDLPLAARAPLVRGLLDLGATRAAEPHLRELATREGGAWVFAYDEALAEGGNHRARAAWWRSRGLRGDVPVEDRRIAAFKLLELRDKAGSEDVWRALAAREPADGASVTQLLHLWGPRPSRAALDWLEARAREADAAAQAGWLQHLVDLGAAPRAVDVLGRSPDPSDGARFDAWLNALRATRDREGLRVAIERAVAVSRDAARLEGLARLALAESLPGAAERAFSAQVEVAPDSLEARRWLGLLAAARNDTVVAREHLEHYVVAGGRDPEALLRHGELLERDRRADAARRAYEIGLQESERADRRSVTSRRVHAFLLAHAGRVAEAQRDLEALVAEQPADAHLRADYVAWLMKEGRHADAQRVLDLPSALADGVPPDLAHAAVPQDAADATVTSRLEGEALVVSIDAVAPLASPPHVDGAELLLTFDGPVRFALAPSLIESSGGRVGNVRTGYDTLLVTAARAVEFSCTERPGGLDVSIVARGAANAADEALGQRRLALLRAQWFAATGAGAAELRTLTALAQDAPDDARVLTALGATERRIGWRRRATTTVERALAADRADPEARRLLADMRADRAPRARVDFEHKDVEGEWQATSQRSDGTRALSESLQIGGRLELLRFDARRVRRPSGAIAPLQRTLQRGEAWLDFDSRGGPTWSASLFGAASGPGAGAGLVVPRPSGRWHVQAEVNRPYWEFVEGLADGGTRDRVAVERRQRLGRRADAWVVASANRYAIDDGANARTVNLSGGVIVAVRQEAPFVAVSYGLDMESLRGVTQRTDLAGATFAPVPVVSREIHVPGVQVRQAAGKALSLDLYAGYAIDRLGGRGLVTEAHARWSRVRVNWEAWVDRRLQTLSTTTTVTRAGVGVAIKF